jgi:hypothetical protein
MDLIIKKYINVGISQNFLLVKQEPAHTLANQKVLAYLLGALLLSRHWVPALRARISHDTRNSGTEVKQF